LALFGVTLARFEPIADGVNAVVDTVSQDNVRRRKPECAVALTSPDAAPPLLGVFCLEQIPGENFGIRSPHLAISSQIVRFAVNWRRNQSQAGHSCHLMPANFH
jgi:hypothetical protein